MTNRDKLEELRLARLAAYKHYDDTAAQVHTAITISAAAIAADQAAVAVTVTAIIDAAVDAHDAAVDAYAALAAYNKEVNNDK